MPSVRCVFAAMAAAVLFSAALAQARDVTVTLTDGRKLTGTLVTQTADSLTLRISGIDSTIPRSQIVGEPQMELGVLEQYQQKRAAIADDDLGARYLLARSVYDQAEALAKETGGAPRALAAYELALRELDSILQVNANMEQPKLLRNVVQERIAALKAAAPGPRPPAPRPGPRPVPPGAAKAPGPGQAPAPSPAAVVPGEAPRLLNEKEINLIKVFEVNLQNKPRISVPRDVIDKILLDFRDTPEMQRFLGREGERKLRTMTPPEQLGLIFDLRARDLYGEVIIRDLPETLVEFRTLIHINYLQNYCGRCHADGKAAGLWVVTKPRPQAEEVMFTNLMVLRKTPTKNIPLIFPDDPERSLLLQYGLPPQDAITPHPEVNKPGMPRWTPFFSGPQDEKFKKMAQWQRTIWKDEYGIDFQIAGPAPAVEPVAIPPKPEAPGGPKGVPAPGAGRNPPAAPAPPTPPRPAPRPGVVPRAVQP